MEARYDHKAAETQAQQLWESRAIYDPAQNPGPLYTVDTPPPTVSGTLHIGHIFSYTQTDIIARYKRMQGYSVVYPFGFDDNGLPTERFVEKKAKVRAHEMSRSDFIALCLKETKEVEEQFKLLWQRMGLSVNWNYCYTTISDSVRRLSQASFLDLLRKGYVYRTNEPALYCTSCRTSVAQAELDDAQIASTFNTILFKDSHGNELPVATTRPELLPSCVALLFNGADVRYQHLRGTQVTVPLFGFSVPVFEDAKVMPEKGTGLVMCCTFGDTTDIEWYKKFKFPFKQSIGLDGKFVKGTDIPQGPKLEGLKVAEARAMVIEELKNRGLLRDQKAIMHSVSVHERCKNEIEYCIVPQWFIRILDFKKEFLALADQITWYPSFMKSRYSNWVENLGWDWCISRQRKYGIPFPVWHCDTPGCGEMLVAREDQLPCDLSMDKQPEYPDKTHRNPDTHVIGCKKCYDRMGYWSAFLPDTDVMDTWNTSALTPYIIAELQNEEPVHFGKTQSSVHNALPLSMRPQAHDIIRAWAFYTITRAWMHDATIPWRTIVISGHVLSNQKDKLSKSQGNATLSPEQLLANYSADVIRYWTASAGLGQDVALSENQFKIGQKLVTKLWNAFRFIFMHCESYQHTPTMPEHLGIVNEWIMHAMSECFTRYTFYFDTHEFSLALDSVERFFWHSFCDNYLELIKDQLFKPEHYSADSVAATQWTLYHIGLRILQLYAPFIPHVTEALYQELYKKDSGVFSLHQTKFAAIQQNFIAESSLRMMERILHIIAAVRKLKSESNLSLKAEITTLALVGNTATLFQDYEALLRGITGAQEISYQSGVIESAQLVQEDQSWYAQVPV
jgi:valyl-tRNA synthetase